MLNISKLKDTILYAVCENDTIKMEYKYENNQLIQIKGYYPDGSIFGISNFNNNIRNGGQYRFFKNGSMDSFFYVENEQIVSPFVQFYQNGMPKIIDNRFIKSNNKLSIEFYITGLINTIAYLNDTASKAFIEVKYYENGNISSVDTANLGKRIFADYYPNGQLQMLGYEYNAIWWQVGKWQEWYENGVLKREYFFNEDIPNQKEGTWKWWDEQGHLIKEEEYKNGELIKSRDYLKGEIKRD
jgi:antitoxin component YwqK of YwqJK toxin-antitoxin module